MNIKELKANMDYDFECNMDKRRMLKEIANTDYVDEWGSAFVWLGNDLVVEYNFCIDDEICSAIYKSTINNDGYLETDYSTSIHYEIDFDNRNWKKELENTMCKALIEFFNL